MSKREKVIPVPSGRSSEQGRCGMCFSICIRTILNYNVQCWLSLHYYLCIMELIYPDILPPLLIYPSCAGAASAATSPASAATSPASAAGASSACAADSAAAAQFLIEAREVLPIVEPDGRVVGRALRRSCHSPELRPLHPVVHLHLLDGKGGLYLQKRALSKLLLPGYWDTAVGGHISYGESVSEALKREAGEEIGLFGFQPLHLLTYVWESATERELVNVFAVVGDFTPVPDKEEVSDGKFWSFKELDDSVKLDNSENLLLTPNFRAEYKRIANQLKCLSTSNSCCE